MVGGAALVALAGWWLAETSPPADSVALSAPASGSRVSATSAAAPPRTASVAANGPDSMLDPALMRIFESVLAESQAASKVAFMAEAPSLLAKHLPRELQPRALGLLGRYVDMQEALRSVAPPDPNDPNSLRHVLQARDEVRRRYFAPEEIEGVFGDDIRQDHFMAEKLEIMHNPALTPAQRQAALDASESAWLTPEQRKQRSESVSYADVQRQTAELDARGASAQERFAVRSAQYGNEAATNLANLDRENQEWSLRVDQYASAPAAEKEQLRDALFNETERLRLDAALALRASRRPAAASTSSASKPG